MKGLGFKAEASLGVFLFQGQAEGVDGLWTVLDFHLKFQGFTE